MLGIHQLKNAAVVLSVIDTLISIGWNITEEHIRQGLKDVSWPGRFDVVSRDPLFIIDGGHNEGCMLALRAMAEKHLKGKKITVLMASMRDKDYRKSIEIILPLCENAVFTRTDEIRGESPGVLAECGRQHCKNVFFCDEVQEAYKKALSLTGEKDVLLC